MAFNSGQIRLISISLVAMILLNMSVVAMGLGDTNDFADPPKIEFQFTNEVESLQDWGEEPAEVQSGSVSWDSVNDDNNPWKGVGGSDGVEEIDISQPIMTGQSVKVSPGGAQVDGIYGFGFTTPCATCTDAGPVNITNQEDWVMPSIVGEPDPENLGYFHTESDSSNYGDFDKSSGTYQLEDGSTFQYEITGSVTGEGTLEYTLTSYVDVSEEGWQEAFIDFASSITGFFLSLLALLILIVDLIVTLALLVTDVAPYWASIQYVVAQNAPGPVALLWFGIQLPLTYAVVINPLIQVISASDWL